MAFNRHLSDVKFRFIAEAILDEVDIDDDFVTNAQLVVERERGDRLLNVADMTEIWTHLLSQNMSLAFILGRDAERQFIGDALHVDFTDPEVEEQEPRSFEEIMSDTSIDDEARMKELRELAERSAKNDG